MLTTLEFVPSEQQTISGIPDTVEVVVSDPTALVFFTLDGTTPSPFSTLVTEPVSLGAITAGSVTLSAVAYVSDGYGLVPITVLTETYRTDLSDFSPSYSIHGGVAYMYPGGLDIPYWYDAAGQEATFLDVDPAEIDFVESDKDKQGLYKETADVWFRDMVAPEDQPSFTPFPYLSRMTNEDFNPKASVILIDSREDSENKPDVTIMNGPYMTLRNPRTYYRGLDFGSVGGSNHVSGHFVRSFFNRDLHTFVAYYFDTVDARWIKSISTVEPAPPSTVFAPRVLPYVIQWNLFGSYNFP